MLTAIKAEITALQNPVKAKILQRFFKTGKGEYGEGDIFWGLVVPDQRQIAKQFWQQTSLRDIEKLLHSKVHEQRSIALIMLVYKFEKGELSLRQQIFDFYLQNTVWINSWDLVDLSAPKIVGGHIFEEKNSQSKPQKVLPPVLCQLAGSAFLWERRMAVLATFPAIRQNNFDPTMAVASKLLRDPHDLIHKAVGWLLREVGKRDKKVLITFLAAHHKNMPRVMLRYAIEKLSPQERTKFLIF